MTNMEIDYENNLSLNDGEIPSMKLISNDFRHQGKIWQTFIEIHEADDYENVDQSKNLHERLDLFQRVMAVDDRRLSLFTNEYFLLSQEKKFVSFFNRVFEFNEKKAIINLGSKWSSKSNFVIDFQRKNKELDNLDQIVLLKQFGIIINNFDTPYYEINDKQILESYIRYFLRNQGGGILYFDKYSMMAEPGYDMHFDLSFENEEVKEKYLGIANEKHLFFLK